MGSFLLLHIPDKYPELETFLDAWAELPRVSFILTGPVHAVSHRLASRYGAEHINNGNTPPASLAPLRALLWRFIEKSAPNDLGYLYALKPQTPLEPEATLKAAEEAPSKLAAYELPWRLPLTPGEHPLGYVPVGIKLRARELYEVYRTNPLLLPPSPHCRSPLRALTYRLELHTPVARVPLPQNPSDKLQLSHELLADLCERWLRKKNATRDWLKGLALAAAMTRPGAWTADALYTKAALIYASNEALKRELPRPETWRGRWKRILEELWREGWMERTPDGTFRPSATFQVEHGPRFPK